SGFVAGAAVTIRHPGSSSPARTVTTGPDGRFDFPGAPMGQFNLSAEYQLPGGMRVKGSAPGTLTEAAPAASVNVPLQLLGVLPVRVVRNDGITPAENVKVILRGPGGKEWDNDTDGFATFANLPLGHYSVTAVLRTAEELRNGIVTSAPVSIAGTNALIEIRL